MDEELSWMGALIQSGGDGGPWEEILHSLSAGDRRHCHHQWHRWEIFLVCRLKVGLV